MAAPKTKQTDLPQTTDNVVALPPTYEAEAKAKRKPYQVLAHCPSESNPNKFYELRLGGDGNVYCTCPAWKFQKKHPKARRCKHMTKMARYLMGIEG